MLKENKERLITEYETKDESELGWNRKSLVANYNI